jgi:hypothetical protein
MSLFPFFGSHVDFPLFWYCTVNAVAHVGNSFCTLLCLLILITELSDHRYDYRIIVYVKGVGRLRNGLV